MSYSRLTRYLIILTLSIAASARAAAPAPPPDPLQLLYARGGLLWFDGPRLTPAGRDLLREMRDAQQRGLVPADYDAVTLAIGADASGSPRATSRPPPSRARMPATASRNPPGSDRCGRGRGAAGSARPPR